MKACIYARVSTSKQSTENQMPVLEAWCEKRGWEVVGRFEEDGSAWDAGHQPELARLNVLARQGKFDLLVIWALDRLTREGIGAIFQKVATYRKFGVRIVSYQETWTELPDSTTDLYMAISAWIAQQESKRRSERVKAGLARKKLEGMGVRGPDQHKRTRRWRRKPVPVAI